MKTMTAWLCHCSLGLSLAFSMSACQAETVATSKSVIVANEEVLQWQDVVSLNEPWAMVFVSNDAVLITEKSGQLQWVDVNTKAIHNISGVPAVVYGGQGGLGDVALHPDFANNRLVYLSYAEAGDKHTQGAAVVRAKLEGVAPNLSLQNVEVIWRQMPKVTGKGHYGHRLLFGHDGKLWISSSERQKFQPAQDMNSHLGKIIRLNDDGSTPSDNPFVGQGAMTEQIWSLGHRNILGMALDVTGRLWVNEMGPQGGDEFNLIQKRGNYGYPEVSDGDHYSGRVIPNHDTRPEFIAPKIVWTPVISPSSLIRYQGSGRPNWQHDFLMGGLSSKALIRERIQADSAQEMARYDMKERIRSVAQSPDGRVWILEDGRKGRLRQLLPP
ncbi:glucose/sorbosone dehydrogenase [Vitreoscilla sp. C1]|uniref:PQQ-dependent sugar dehydrogenase n=1 Tax=Vitreoscilla sp. (strain C1) TaxID=96942 RepID=UPI00148EE5E7|nr:PQQ-dependent sugar dehydrogenase [Vitreoscilla sp. C1]AUZ04279.2 glucose/sorbosone dehydrogenase [Vitreoscilla sp. C1]